MSAEDVLAVARLNQMIDGLRSELAHHVGYHQVDGEVPIGKLESLLAQYSPWAQAGVPQPAESARRAEVAR